MSPQAIVRVDPQALADNLARMRRLAAPSRVMAMLKSEAYGHGLETAAAAFADADAFAVASLDEAERLRAAGHTKRSVWLTGPRCADDLADASRLDLDLVVHHCEQVDWLAAHRSAPFRVWLKVDTGMHRLGVAAGEAVALHASLCELPSVTGEVGLMTHLACADEPDSPATAEQIAEFDRVTAGLEGPRSLCNSPGMLGWPDARGDWVRAGGLLYGLSLVEGRSGADDGYRAAMTFDAPLIAIKQLATGDRVGYGGIWTAPRAMRLGVIAAGYGDGYPRSAPSCTPVLLRERRVALVGRVSMNYLTVDLDGVPDAALGDRAILFGPGLPAEILATHAGTIAYEITCRASAAHAFAPLL